MAIEKIHIDDFLTLAKQHPVLDVRSPGEFNHAHIPGASSLHLFTDEERKVVGTIYKQQSREQAIKTGLDYFGVKMRKMVEEAEALAVSHKPLANNNSTNPQPAATNSKTVLVHCWRGGMRSAGVAWLLDLYGFKVYTLIGGYKQFRKWVLEQFEKQYPFQVLGGYTGSGKTYVLGSLKKHGEVVVDLEELAHHKGSAFGNLGMPKQPSQEMFENKLSLALFSSAQQQKPVWVEDESQRIGDINIPINLWRQIRVKPLFFLDIPFEERLKHIVAEYGQQEKEKLEGAILRIKKRLGGLETKEAVNALLEERMEDCFRILLAYYDKCYLKGLHNREGLETLLHNIPCETVHESNMNQLLQPH